jgi:hypothetical protein
LSLARRPGMSSSPHPARRARKKARTHRRAGIRRLRNPLADQRSWGTLQWNPRGSLYRTGSSSAALRAARRTQLQRGLALVLGVFLMHALAYCIRPQSLTVQLPGGLHGGELAAAATASVILLAVLLHDRDARRHIEPLAQCVVQRPAQTRPTAPRTAEPTPAAPEFDAFDPSRAFNSRTSSRAFDSRTSRRTNGTVTATARATT